MLYGIMAKLNEQVVFKAPREWVEELAREAAKDRRTVSAVNRAIWERGYRAFKQDGMIFDPGEAEGPQLVPDTKARAAKKKAAKKENRNLEKTGTS